MQKADKKCEYQYKNWKKTEDKTECTGRSACIQIIFEKKTYGEKY